MKKPLCLWASLLSVQSSSLYVEECGSIVRFKQEMARVYQNNIESDDMHYHDLSFDEIQLLRDQWCSNVPQSAHLKEALMRLGHMLDKEVSKNAQNLLRDLEDVLFHVPRKKHGDDWRTIIHQLNDLEDLLL